jgi:hypothetical protein
LSTAETQRELSYPGTFNRGLTVTGVNTGEQRETRGPEFWLE